MNHPALLRTRCCLSHSFACVGRCWHWSACWWFVINWLVASAIFYYFVSHPGRQFLCLRQSSCFVHSAVGAFQRQVRLCYFLNIIQILMHTTIDNCAFTIQNLECRTLPFSNITVSFTLHTVRRVSLAQNLHTLLAPANVVVHPSGLHSHAAFPNMALPFFGGLIVDKVCL